MSIPYEGEGTTGPGLTGISTSAPGIVGTSDSGPGIVGASGLAVLGASAATGEDGVLGLSGTGASSAPQRAFNCRSCSELATSSVLRRSIPADSRGAKEDGPI
jgi:hypothetical protein